MESSQTFPYAIGSNITISCPSGHEIVGPRDRTCLSNGQWSGRHTACDAEGKKKLEQLLRKKFCCILKSNTTRLIIFPGCFRRYLPEMESRNQRSRPRSRNQKHPRQGQRPTFRGQTLSRPRTGMVEARAKDQERNFSELWSSNFLLFLSAQMFRIFYFVKLLMVIRKQ